MFIALNSKFFIGTLLCVPEMMEVMKLRGEGEGEMITTVVIHDLHGQQAQPNNKRNRCLEGGNNVSSSQKKPTVFNHTRDIVP